MSLIPNPLRKSIFDSVEHHVKYHGWRPFLSNSKKKRRETFLKSDTTCYFFRRDYNPKPLLVQLIFSVEKGTLKVRCSFSSLEIYDPATVAEALWFIREVNQVAVLLDGKKVYDELP